MKYKKASSQVGIAIIAMAILLLLGGIFTNPNTTINNNNNINEHNNYNNSNYLFYLKNTNIGKQNKITQSYDNIILGSKKEYNIIYLGNNFILNSNPFTKNSYSFDINFENPKEVNNYLIYFKTIRSSGDENLKIYVDNKLISDNKARNNDIPIKVNYKPKNSTVKIRFELEKPKFYDIFNWNKILINELKVVEEKQNKENNNRKFNFPINKKNLEKAYLQTTIKCNQIKDISEPIIIKINGQIIANQNPNCKSNYNVITTQIPNNILNEKNNDLEFETKGLYKIAYSLNKIYFNEQSTYSFNVNSFNDIMDITISGDFDRDVIDFKLNSYQLSLNKEDILSLIKYVRFGTNELKILTKPVEIKELKIEKNEYMN